MMTLNLGKRPPRRRGRGGSGAGSLNPDNRRLYLDAMGGRAVGLLPAARFVSTRVHLSPGDTLVLYTDGLTEAKTGTGAERYDDDNALIEFAAAHAPATATSIVTAIQSLLDGLGEGVGDDTAVLALGVPR